MRTSPPATPGTVRFSRIVPTYGGGLLYPNQPWLPPNFVAFRDDWSAYNPGDEWTTANSPKWNVTAPLTSAQFGGLGVKAINGGVQVTSVKGLLNGVVIQPILGRPRYAKAQIRGDCTTANTAGVAFIFDDFGGAGSGVMAGISVNKPGTNTFFYLQGGPAGSGADVQFNYPIGTHFLQSVLTLSIDVNRKATATFDGNTLTKQLGASVGGTTFSLQLNFGQVGTDFNEICSCGPIVVQGYSS